MKILSILVLTLSFSSAFAFTKDALPPPYNSVQVMPFDNGGWFYNAIEFENIFNNNNIKTVIEVGCHFGLSSRFIAAHLPENGTLYAVDHWAWFPLCYEQFLSNTIHAGLTHIITPIRMDSLNAASYFCNLKDRITPDLIYIDASHDTDSVYQDLVAWHPLLNGQGILCGDDWTFEEVQIAVNRFAKEKTMKIEASGNFWLLKE